MSTHTNRLLAAALDAVTAGFHVFPLRPGTKIPALHGDSARRPCPRTGPCTDGHLGWEQRATNDPEAVTRCWSAGPFNIGIATGPSRLVVVDLDTPKSPTSSTGKDGCSRQRAGEWGRDVFTALCIAGGHRVEDVFDTRAVATARAGEHLYYRAPSTVELRNSESKLGLLIDTRAGGGYVVGPGSATPDGQYVLTDAREPAELPGWLVQALAPRPRTALSAPNVSRAERLPAYIDAALRGEWDRVAAAQSGAHSKTLFIAAVALGRHVGTGDLPSTTAEARLYAAATHMITGKCGCTERKVNRTIQDGLRAGSSTARPVRPGSPEPPTTPLFGQRGAA